MSSLASDAATGDDGAFSLRSKRSEKGADCGYDAKRQWHRDRNCPVVSPACGRPRSASWNASKRQPTRRAAVTGGTSPPGGSLNRIGSINPWQTAPQWGSTLGNGGRVPTPRNLQGPGRDNSIYYWLR